LALNKETTSNGAQHRKGHKELPMRTTEAQKELEGIFSKLAIEDMLISEPISMHC
jgi:hypothetical protein